MIAGLLLGLLADVVFNSATSMRRSFGLDMERYLADRGLAAKGKAAPRSRR